MEEAVLKQIHRRVADVAEARGYELLGDDAEVDFGDFRINDIAGVIACIYVDEFQWISPAVAEAVMLLTMEALGLSPDRSIAVRHMKDDYGEKASIDTEAALRNPDNMATAEQLSKLFEVSNEAQG